MKIRDLIDKQAFDMFGQEVFGMAGIGEEETEQPATNTFVTLLDTARATMRAAFKEGRDTNVDEYYMQRLATLTTQLTALADEAMGVVPAELINE